MSRIDPEVVRALVRRALEETLGTTEASVRLVARGIDDPVHPSQCEILAETDSGDGPELPEARTCLIEPHRLCSNSGYCRKLGY